MSPFHSWVSSLTSLYSLLTTSFDLNSYLGILYTILEERIKNNNSLEAVFPQLV